MPSCYPSNIFIHECARNMEISRHKLLRAVTIKVINDIPAGIYHSDHQCTLTPETYHLKYRIVLACIGCFSLFQLFWSVLYHLFFLFFLVYNEQMKFCVSVFYLFINVDLRILNILFWMRLYECICLYNDELEKSNTYLTLTGRCPALIFTKIERIILNLQSGHGRDV